MKALSSLKALQSLPRHYVQPLGNLLLDPEAYNCKTQGLGNCRCLNDESIVNCLRYLDYNELCALMRTSKAFYVFCHDEELWRTLTLNVYGGDIWFQMNWHTTFAYQHVYSPRKQKPTDGSIVNDSPVITTESIPLAKIDIKGFYSDVLFQPFMCSTVDLSIFSNADTIDRVDGMSLSNEEFLRLYGIPNKPVVITGVCDKWPAFTKWTKENLCASYPDIKLKAGRFLMNFRQYFQYADRVVEESPLYLFDSTFGEKIPDLLKDYEVPSYCENDLFSLLEELTADSTYDDGCEDRGEDGNPGQNGTDNMNQSWGTMRPSFRWILIGPARSGSTFHKDPNHTSAWNGLLSGEKKWLLYPPNMPPPGVITSEDGRDVATPISVTEWFLNFYDEHTQLLKEHTRRKKRRLDSNSDGLNSDNADVLTPNRNKYDDCGPVEVTCKPGDLIFIPNGWWHLALNLTPSVAVTQNYVNEQNLLNVLNFLEVEGNERLLNAFNKMLKLKRPGLIDSLRQIAIDTTSFSKKKRPMSLWDQIIADT